MLSRPSLSAQFHPVLPGRESMAHLGPPLLAHTSVPPRLRELNAVAIVPASRFVSAAFRDTYRSMSPSRLRGATVGTPPTRLPERSGGRKVMKATLLPLVRPVALFVKNALVKT